MADRESQSNDEITRTARLLERLRHGDQDAARRLFAPHRDRLLKVAERTQRRIGALGRTDRTAEDEVQEAYQRALLYGVLADAERELPGWLACRLDLIVRAATIDGERRRRAARRGGGRLHVSCDALSDATSGAAHAAGLPGREPTPTSQARVTELVESIKAVLEPHQWEAWSLIMLEGWRASDVAKRMGRSAASVRCVYQRARIRIAKCVPLSRLR